MEILEPLSQETLGIIPELKAVQKRACYEVYLFIVRNAYAYSVRRNHQSGGDVMPLIDMLNDDDVKGLLVCDILDLFAGKKTKQREKPHDVFELFGPAFATGEMHAQLMALANVHVGMSWHELVGRCCHAGAWELYDAVHNQQ